VVFQLDRDQPKSRNEESKDRDDGVQLAHIKMNGHFGERGAADEPKKR
jgi:hypothetical protein